MKEAAITPSTGFNHDKPYMKLDIWEPGEIENLFGHDPATYPNQDLLQHYPEVQFNPPVKPVWEAMDSSMNVHTMPHQKARQTSRPGFQNKPYDLPHNNFLATSVSESNQPGIEHTLQNGLPVVPFTQDVHADPKTKAHSVRPGFQNKPAPIDNDFTQAVSLKHSNEAGGLHALDNTLDIKAGYQPIICTTEVKAYKGDLPKNVIYVDPTKATKTQDGSVVVQAPNGNHYKLVSRTGNHYNGTICDALGVEKFADSSVDALMGTKEQIKGLTEAELLVQESKRIESLLGASTNSTPAFGSIRDLENRQIKRKTQQQDVELTALKLNDIRNGVLPQEAYATLKDSLTSKINTDVVMIEDGVLTPVMGNANPVMNKTPHVTVVRRPTIAEAATGCCPSHHYDKVTLTNASGTKTVATVHTN